MNNEGLPHAAAPVYLSRKRRQRTRLDPLYTTARIHHIRYHANTSLRYHRFKQLFRTKLKPHGIKSKEVNVKLLSSTNNDRERAILMTKMYNYYFYK